MDGSGAEEAASDKDDDEDEDDPSSSSQQDSWTTLILILVYEHLRGAASPWRPYLDILPAGPSEFTTPMFWADDELAELQASPVAGRVGRAEAEAMIRTKIVPVVRAHEDVFFPADANIAPLSDDELVALASRMGSVIMAYAFDLEKEEDDDEEKKGDGDEEEEEDEWVEDREGKTTLGMVPMADVLNADASFNAHIEHGADALVATSLRPIAAGDEILNYYGPLSCGELLRRYGYVTTAHRRWNLVDLSWGRVLAALRSHLGLRDEEWVKVVASLEEEEMLDEDDGFVVERGASDPDEEGRVADVTGRAGPPEELVEQVKEVMKVVKKVRPDAVPDKVARDRAIYSAIAAAVDERTKQYGTTLEEDLALHEKLEAGGAGAVLDRKRMALDVRIGEKQLLKEVCEAVREKLAGLEVAQRDGDGRSAKRRKM